MAQQQPDEEALRALIAEHGGNLSAIARALGTRRQQLTRHMTPELLAAAEAARVGSATRGRRSHLDPNAPELAGDRQRLLDAIARAGGYRTAAKVLGIGESTAARARKRFGITDDEIARRRAELDAA